MAELKGYINKEDNIMDNNNDHIFLGTDYKGEYEEVQVSLTDVSELERQAYLRGLRDGASCQD